MPPRVGNRVGGDPVQPGCKGNSTPFEARKILEGMMKHFGGEIFGLSPILYPADDERIHTFKVGLVKFGETPRILLRRLDQQPFLFHHLETLTPVSYTHLTLPTSDLV